MNSVVCIFKRNNDSEPELWKIFDNRQNAIKWIEMYSEENEYIWEEWSVHTETPRS